MADAYTAEQVASLIRRRAELSEALQHLMLEGLRQSQGIENKQARDHLLHGAGRRIEVIRKAAERIFELFPPSRKRPLPRDALHEAQIHLHAFVINVAGIFDNWAWAFVLRHGLRLELGDATNISLFKRRTQRYLPRALRDYLTSDVMVPWHRDYAKAYRDALAHRIPVYIPPARWTEADVRRYEELEREKSECIRNRQWDRVEHLRSEQELIGRACLVFMHEYSAEQTARPVLLHPQLTCDSATVEEFGRRFYACWHERETPGSDA